MAPYINQSYCGLNVVCHLVLEMPSCEVLVTIVDRTE